MTVWSVLILGFALALIALLAVQADSSLREVRLDEARAVAAALDVEALERLSGTPADVQNPAYAPLVERLQHIRADTGSRFVYLFGIRPNPSQGGSSPAVIFLADVEDDAVELGNSSQPGDPYDEASPELRALFQGGTGLVEGPLTDQWGTFVSALVPLLDPGTGKVVAVLGMDVEAADWRWQVASAAAVPATLVVLLAWGSLLLLHLRRGERPSTRPVLRRLMPSLTLLLGLLFVLGGFLQWQQFRRLESTQAKMADELLTSDLLGALHMASHGLENTALVLAADEALAPALRSGDTAALLGQWDPVFRKMKRETGLSHLYFYNAERRVVARLHRPDDLGDVVDRPLLLEAVHTGRATRGLEIGTSNNLVVRVVQPVRTSEGLAGFVEVGMNIQSVLDTVRLRPGTHFVLLMDKAGLNRARWEREMQAQGLEHDWGLLADSVVLHSSLRGFPAAFFARLAEHRGNEGVPVEEGGHTWSVAGHALADSSGRDIASLMVLQDTTGSHAAFRRFLLVGGLAAFLLLAATLAYVYVLLRRTDAGLLAQQKSLRDAEQEFRLLFDHSVAAIAICEMIPGPEGQPVDYVIISANKAFEHHSGISRQRIVGQRVGQAASDPQESTFFSRYAEVMRTGQASSFEAYSEPLQRWLAVTAYPLSATRFATVFTDVTQRVEANRRLEQLNRRLQTAAVQAQAASAAKSAFMANLSHELRTPMNGCLGMSELLLSTDLSTQQQEYLGLLRESGERMMEVVDQLLALADLDTGAEQVTPQDFDLREVVRQEAARTAAACRRKGLSFRCRIAPGTPREVRGGLNHLRRILHNLADNAVKFTNLGRVILQVRPDPAHEGCLRFEVADTGIGVPEEGRRSLFDPFWQADSSLTRRQEGLGLGLAVAKHFVELLGGEIGYHDHAGGGMVFWFRVPLPAPPSAVAPEVPSSVPPTAGPDAVTVPPLEESTPVLVVEDNALNRFVVMRMVKNAGYTVEAVPDGNAALQRLEESRFGLVLMDVAMPGLDGCATTRRFRAGTGSSATPRDVPILAITARAMAGDREECLEAGMNDYLVKPFRTGVLQAKLRCWLPLPSETGRVSES